MAAILEKDGKARDSRIDAVEKAVSPEALKKAIQAEVQASVKAEVQTAVKAAPISIVSSLSSSGPAANFTPPKIDLKGACAFGDAIGWRCQFLGGLRGGLGP